MEKNEISSPKKKRIYTTKQLIVPARYFLECLASRTVYPISLSLLYAGGGVCRSISNQTELQAFIQWEELNESNLIYIRYLNSRLYIELCNDGRLTVDKKLLPGVYHMSVLSRCEVIRLWKQLFKVIEQDKRSQQEVADGSAQEPLAA